MGAELTASAAAAANGHDLDARASLKLGLLALVALVVSSLFGILGDEEVGDIEFAVGIGSLLLAVNGLRLGARAARARRRAGVPAGRRVLLGLVTSGLVAALWVVGLAVALAA